MKICFIAPANNYHTQKWCKWFSGKGHEVHVISFRQSDIAGCTLHYIPIKNGSNASDFEKIGMLFKAKQIKKIVDSIQPDIVNVHYATSYGTAVALSGIKTYILSVWGSDIYDFPRKSYLHQMMLEYSLNKATWLFSTSRAMAEEGAKYTKKEFEITPFGVDMKMFSPLLRTKNRGKFIIGTVKKLEPVYGIDYLLKAVANIKSIYPEMDIELRIAGDGASSEEYKQLAKDLQIEDITVWLGFISQEQVAYEWAHMDVAVIYSNQESFGVSAVEAQACGTALIVSDIPGLKETTIPGETSIAVQPRDIHKLTDAIRYLYLNPRKRELMGIAGREFVLKQYELNSCFDNIEGKFASHIGGGGKMKSPFMNVDYELFRPISKKIVIGTVKSLSDKYGIDYLLRAFALVKEKHPEWTLELRIAGNGPLENEYKRLSIDLNIADYTRWLGFISQEEVAKEWANMDIGIVYSTLDSESFGVSAVECNACGTPVIISDVPGLMEATKPDYSSLVVQRCEDRYLADAIVKLIIDNKKAKTMGQRGRTFVEQNYELDRCFEHIEDLFKKFASSSL